MKSLLNIFFLSSLTLSAFILAGCSSSSSNGENTKLTANAWCVDEEQKEIAHSTYLDTTAKFTFQADGVLKYELIMAYSYSYGDNLNRHNENAVEHGTWAFDGSELITQIDEQTTSCNTKFIADNNESLLKLECIESDGERTSIAMYSCK